MKSLKRTVIERAKRLANRLLSRRGYQLVWFGAIPDDLPNAEMYRPMFQPWAAKHWRDFLALADSRTVVTDDRRYVICQLLQQAVRNVAGDVAECGVYRGGTARLMARTIEKHAPERELHLFDTFTGTPQAQEGLDYFQKGSFADTSAQAVAAFVGDSIHVRFHEGVVPETLESVCHKTFSLVHLDMDNYEPTLAASQFFYERVSPGGFIVYDDYGDPMCPGVLHAVDEFYANKPEKPLVLTTGQCIVFRAGCRSDSP